MRETKINSVSMTITQKLFYYKIFILDSYSGIAPYFRLLPRDWNCLKRQFVGEMGITELPVKL